MKGFPVEYRGLVYSTGGDKYIGEFSYDLAVTIPNFLKTYNPDLQGQSEGDSVPFTQGINLNAAIVEAKIADVPKQVTYLVNTLKTQYNTTVDFDEDWKLLTLFIGANNLCICCHNDSRGTPQYFETHLRDILQQIETNIPRTFVNLVALFNISGVWTAGEQHEYCSILWDGITVGECGCLLEYGNEERKSMDEHSVLYNEVMYKVAAEFASKNNANFTVVVQPGLSGFDIGYFGEGYLSALDCFHPSLPANEAFTIALWNNMLTPPPNKKTTIDPSNVKILCPTEDSFFQ
uniref:SGNH hydrolase-type esterase domain-containing protein n=1 Tax=Arcella intermedia TaxID=1963864 RepID=A0A6B2LBJ1_9EUKA